MAIRLPFCSRSGHRALRRTARRDSPTRYPRCWPHSANKIRTQRHRRPHRQPRRVPAHPARRARPRNLVRKRCRPCWHCRRIAPIHKRWRHSSPMRRMTRMQPGRSSPARARGSTVIITNTWTAQAGVAAKISCHCSLEAAARRPHRARQPQWHDHHVDHLCGWLDREHDDGRSERRVRFGHDEFVGRRRQCGQRQSARTPDSDAGAIADARCDAKRHRVGRTPHPSRPDWTRPPRRDTAWPQRRLLLWRAPMSSCWEPASSELRSRCISSSAGLRLRWSTALGRGRGPPTAIPASSKATPSFRRPFRRIG